jgi:hypothetical protein
MFSGRSSAADRFKPAFWLSATGSIAGKGCFPINCGEGWSGLHSRRIVWQTAIFVAALEAADEN